MGKTRLMIVDDEVDLLAELKPLLERSGYQVCCAACARLGIGRLSSC
jgi:DNA-binding response OmpR family regulator